MVGEVGGLQAGGEGEKNKRRLGIGWVGALFLFQSRTWSFCVFLGLKALAELRAHVFFPSIALCSLLDVACRRCSGGKRTSCLPLESYLFPMWIGMIAHVDGLLLHIPYLWQYRSEGKGNKAFATVFIRDRRRGQINWINSAVTVGCIDCKHHCDVSSSLLIIRSSRPTPRTTARRP